jgi:hypothetical protein
MAKFAEIKQIEDPFDSTKTIWKVQRVVSVCNSVVPSNGHVDGETWCNKFFKGGTWKQTSYNTRNGVYYTPDPSGSIVQDPDQTKAFRHNYAGENYVYDFTHDVFYPVQRFASHTLNTTTFEWEAPIAYPSIINDGADPSVWHYFISWNETKYQADNNTGWEATRPDQPGTVYNWNGTAWIAE